MVSRFTFVHFASSKSLIKKSRRKILKISKKRRSTLPKLFKKLRIQIEYANKKNTNKIMKSILKEYHKSEILCHKIFVDQILVVFEIQKRQIKSEKNLKHKVGKVFSELKPEHQNLLKKSNEILQEIRKKISWLIDIMREDERNVLFNRKVLQLKYITPIAFEASMEALKRYFISERRLSSREKKLEKKILNEIIKIPKIVKKINKLKKKIPKLEAKIKRTRNKFVRSFLIMKLKSKKNKLKMKIKELDEVIIQLKNDVKQLKIIIKDLTEILREIFLISTRLRIKFRKNLGQHGVDNEIKILDKGFVYETLELLDKKGFQEDLLKKLKNKREKILEDLRKHNFEEEKMVKHEKRIDDRQSNHKIAA